MYDTRIARGGLSVKLYGTENNETIMKELGKRMQGVRISMNIKQSEMAEESGVSLRTICRMEQGESVSVESVLNVLRVLKVLPNLDLLIQEQTLMPTEIVDYGKKRQRVSSKKAKRETMNWTWGDEKE